jgi:hypothetical protein
LQILQSSIQEFINILKIKISTNTKMKTKIIIGIGLSILLYSNSKAQQTTASGSNAPQASTNLAGGNLWGTVFGDYAYVRHGDSAGRGNGNLQYKGLGAQSSPTQNQNAFEIRRAYLGYDYTINDAFSASALLAYEGDADANGNRTIYLKNAFLKWQNIFPKSDLIVGQQFTASSSAVEDLWGYRDIERTMMDLRKIDGTTDMGATLKGILWQAKSDSNQHGTSINYSFMIGDNSGNTPVPVFTNAGTVQNSTTDKDKKFRINLFLRTLNNKLTIGFYADYINYGGVEYKTEKLYQNATQTLRGYVAYNVNTFGVGAEYFVQNNANGELEILPNDGKLPNPGNDTVTATQTGFSVFGHVTIIPNKLNVFARYDGYNPDTRYVYSTTEAYISRLVAQNTYKETFITTGLDWTPKPDKKVHILPNVWYDGINNGYGSDNLKSDYYLVYRITFQYSFK